MPIQHDDLIPGVTKVRVTRHTRSMAADLEYLDMPSIRVPAIGTVGTVAASYGLRGKRIPVDFAAPGAPEGGGGYDCDIEILEIVENPPALEPFPVGTTVRLAAIDPRHRGVGAAIPKVGLVGKVVETEAPRWCQTVRFASADLGYEVDPSSGGEDGSTVAYYILRNCLEPVVDPQETAEPVEAAKEAEGGELDLTVPKVDPDAVIDTRGHWGKTEPMVRRDMDKWAGNDFDDKAGRAALFAKLDLAQYGFLKEDTERFFVETSECYVCQRRFGFRASEGGARYVATTECPYPGGIPDYDVLLAVPSGRIAFANDLRALVEIEEPRGTTVNSMIGQRRHTEAHAAAGLILVSTGNTSPGIWRRPDGTISVGNFRSAGPGAGGGSLDGCEEVGVVTPVDQRGELLGTIDTELWDFCAMDHGRFLARCAALGADPARFDVTVVDVEPGTWAFTVPRRTGRDTATEIFGTGRRTDLPAPAIVEPDLSLSETLHGSQAWKAVVETWSYGFSGNGYRAVDHLLNGYGSGYAWTDGLLRTGTRREDAPFREMDDATPEPTDVHALDAHVPTWRGLAMPREEGLGATGPGVMRPITLGYSKATDIPEAVDPWWLALAVLFAKSVKDRPELYMADHGYTPENGMKAMRTTYGMLLDLVAGRGGVDTLMPYLQAWLAKEETLLAEGPPDASCDG